MGTLCINMFKNCIAFLNKFSLAYAMCSYVTRYNKRDVLCATMKAQSKKVVFPGKVDWRYYVVKSSKPYQPIELSVSKNNI